MTNNAHREEYLNVMGLTKSEGGKEEDKHTKSIKAALDRAHEIRQFEIRMLWQRALYFWGFQAVIVYALSGVLENLYPACCATTSTAPSIFHSTAALALSTLGFLTALGLVFMNRGSKFIQENWEFHIDMLEDDLDGQLHKTILSQEKFCKHCSCITCICNLRQFSGSELNLRISIMFAFAWLLLTISFLPLFFYPELYTKLSDPPHLWAIGTAIIFLTLFMANELWTARSGNTKSKNVRYEQRDITSFEARERVKRQQVKFGR